MGGMTLRERVAQLVMAWLTGGYASGDDAAFLQIESLVSEERIGGLVMSVGTPLGYVSQLNRLQSAARTPLLVTADFESGPGFRVGGIYALPSMLELGGATMLPPAMALGATDDEALAYEAGRITGAEARALGVHLAFAPVLDVNNNPANPIINTRSFGEDPLRVGELGAAFIRGARDAGLLTTAKHFPGHGDTGTDSHVALPVIPGDRARLDSLELVPFRRAIAEGVDAVMTAHVAAPAILGPDAPPATLSSYFMTDVLRGDLGFGGVLFTDALGMAAIVDGYGTGEAAVRALEAGSDVLLMPPDAGEAIDAVVGAVEAGRLSALRIDASVRRILELKARAGLHRAAQVDAEAILDVVGVRSHTAFADSVARRSVTLVRDFAGTVPLDTASIRSILSVTFSRRGNFAAGRIFDRRLAGAFAVRRARVGFDSPSSVYDSLARVAASFDAVLLSAYVSPGAEAGAEDLPPEVRTFMAQLGERQPAAVISFGSPYLLNSLPDTESYLIAWGGAEASQRAAADALLGRSRITGRLPISLPPLHAVGEGLRRGPADGGRGPADVEDGAAGMEDEPADVERDPAGGRRDPAGNQRGPAGNQRGPAGGNTAWAREMEAEAAGMSSRLLAQADSVIESAIGAGAAPGVAIAVGRSCCLVRLRGYGRLDWDPGSPAVTDSSIYDLASLTKVVATTTAVMRLADRGDLSLDDPVGDYLPEWAEGWKRSVTIRHLLAHQGGLPPFRPFWRTLADRAEYRRAIADLEADYEPGTATVYSDIGFITLALVVETLASQPLGQYVGDAVFEPLGMKSTAFNPPASWRHMIAPTEIDTVYRKRHLVGEVHDENAYAMGGVAGHAGLFSSVRDLARFAGWMLNAAREGRGISAAAPLPSALASPLPSVLASPDPATVAHFTAQAGPESSRALGWDTRAEGLRAEGSPSARCAGCGAFGHTGFTGTSIWIDPELDLFVALLTNRVNPTRANRKHIALRRAVHEVVAAAVRGPAPEEDAAVETEAVGPAAGIGALLAGGPVPEDSALDKEAGRPAARAGAMLAGGPAAGEGSR